MLDGSDFPLMPMIVDSFAGGGGASTGIEMALGRSPDVAINHSAAALALHAANHPETLHLDSNIWDVEPRSVTKGRKVGLLWASPDCKHFSKAKGGAPRDRNIRDLAWVVVRWAEEVQPDVIAMENVEEFVTWGPVGEDGQPLDWCKGQTFNLWIKRLRKAGYKVQWRELRACDYGAPTIRKRWFLIARRDGQPIRWPKPTHGDPTRPGVRAGRLQPWRPAAECIDWALPCPSIFDTGPEIMAKHGLRAVRPLAAATMARVARGMKRYVLDANRPFLVNLTHGGRIEDAAEPFRTITGAHRGEKAAVVPSLLSLKGSDRRDFSIEGPHPTILAGGGHSALIAPSITTFNSGATGQDARDPLATVTANSHIKRPGGAAPLGVITPYLANVANSKTTGRGPNVWPLPEPVRTITGANGHAVIAPLLTYAQQGGGNRSAETPHHTICASKKDQNSLIAASLVQTGYGERQGQAPRALDPDAPLGTIVAGGVKHAPIAAFLARHFGQSVGHGADEPTGTITAGGGGKTAPIAAFLAQQNGGPRMGAHTGHDPRDPMSTVAASGSHQTPIAAWFAKYYGTGDGSRTDEPCHTVTVKDRFAHVQADLAAPTFSPEHEAKARKVADFMRAHDSWDDREFVSIEIDGATFIVIDIGMRMLTPRELFTAQGFPRDYVIEGVWEIGSGWENLGHNGGPRFVDFPKDVQISCCGNSVCPPLAAAIIRENCSHLVQEELAA